MSKALSRQSTARSVDVVPVPLLPGSPEPPVAAGRDDPDGGLRFHRPGPLQRVFTAAGEVEAAEWALDQVLEAAASGEEVGVGLDVAPLDGALESARWVLDRAVAALHAEIRGAARHGVPSALLAEASATEEAELRSVLAVADAPAGAGPAPGGLGAAV
ncbi:hypothetical protein [Kocuria rhizosphaericola]|uniref:hypothetical protein n=1 Tax=Kocuria rhizosphaericola TaxID=3376284 RepID=UPI0037B4C3BF